MNFRQTRNWDSFDYPEKFDYLKREMESIKAKQFHLDEDYGSFKRDIEWRRQVRIKDAKFVGFAILIFFAIVGAIAIIGGLM